MSSQTPLAALALCLALLPAPASASQCHETPFAALMREADVIFVGRALTWDAELATTFAVERVFKGSAAATVIVESGAVKYAALAPPDRYLVLADADNPDAKPGNFYVHTCGGSRLLLSDTEIPKELGDGKPPLPPPDPPPTGSTSELPPQASPEPELPPAPPRAGCASCSLTGSAPLPLLLMLPWAVRTRRYRPRPPPPMRG